MDPPVRAGSQVRHSLFPSQDQYILFILTAKEANLFNNDPN